MKMHGYLRWTVAALMLLCAALPAYAQLPPPVDVDIQLAEDGMPAWDDLFSWGGTVAPWSTDFAGGAWDITATGSASNWLQNDDGFSWWWEVAVPGSFHVQSGTEWLRGQGTFSALIFAEDDTYSSIDPWGMHSMAIGEWDGAFTEGNLTGHPPIIGGTFSMFPATLDGWTLVVEGDVPIADGHATFDFFGTVVVGQAQPTPEPAAWVLLLAGAGVVGFVRRRRRPAEA